MTDPQQPPRLLVADDQPAILDALRFLLADEGFEVEIARTPAQILQAVQSRDFDALLMDLNYTRDTTSGREGLDLLPALQGADATLPVIVMTAWGSVDGAVEAIRRGARDYVEKPWDDARLVATLRTQIELGRALRRTQRLEHENRALRRDAAVKVEMIAESAAMQPVLRLMERVGPSDANVLVTGEHGTGKELVARWLHAASRRAARTLVAVNMGGLSEGVFESELFGHVKGAFTDAKTDRVGRFELADGGTLFLDEIGNMSMPQQAKLLRVLQTGEMERVGSSRPRHVDVRVVSATNADVRGEVAAGRFREDLLYRLNTVEIQLPPLRARRDDVPVLAAHFLARHAARYRKALQGFAPDALQVLLAHPWPGNVRELDHAVERAVLMAQGDQVRAVDLALRVDGQGQAALEDMTLETVEKVLIQKALARWNGNVSHAARALGLSRSALYRRMAAHGL
ncbi:sigma-54 dependent transcriptional regulator [Roseisolibacter sp. H3M3-2]|uniref:sigma-54-dependent transcriptional regulator n=1 Tax=Roseisolibacter sp. H3M3-2 TaxID=3031323 RepID=UPI0023D9A961|nr:sigma-54 dependent transcriptional regulator [Roseisolibacter sp. H3M3-2]MDF1504468.1 sigma-54 dependent transcriptional regulator [Roseisolibacter sp. H3M3-2]